MKEEFWNELLDIFFNDEKLQKEHEKLYKNITLIVEHQKKSKEIEEIGKQLAEINKAETKKGN